MATPNRYSLRHWAAAILSLAIAVLATFLSLATAQPPREATPNSGVASPNFSAVPVAKPRSAEDVASFIDTLSAQEGAFEVVAGQGRLVTLKEDIAVRGKNQPLIAVGDPSVLDFELVGVRQIRLIGQRIGVTDFSIITNEGKSYHFEVHVIADLNVLRAKLRAMFPDASLQLAHIRDHVIVEGQARDTAQVGQIIETIRVYLFSIQVGQERKIRSTRAPTAARPAEAPVRPGEEPAAVEPRISPETGGPDIEAKIATPQVINLIRVPGPHQVMLKVRIAELNRTSLRRIGADLLFANSSDGSIIGTQVGGGNVAASGVIDPVNGGLITNTNPAQTFFNTAANTTIYGIFEGADFEMLIQALRRNSVLKILAEPNVVAMNGHKASFLAGGEFPVPIPQGGTGGAPVITIEFKKFGVQLDFQPYVLDGDTIRMTVRPEVSSIDFSLGVQLSPGGPTVPGINTRWTTTTVEMRQGQTLAMAGLIQVTLEGRTNRIPGLGDLPIIGSLFSTTENTRVEKELVVLVTPYLVHPMDACQVPPTPGDEVNEPNDLEFYLLNRIEGRTGKDFRATTAWDDPLHLVKLLHLERRHVTGPCGFSE